MKISIDFDGTITRYPEFFSALMRAMQKDGHTVGILSGRHLGEEPFILAWLGDRGFTVPDFIMCREPTKDPRSGLHKSESIKAHGIDMHIDDCDLNHPDSVAVLGAIEKVICIR